MFFRKHFVYLVFVLSLSTILRTFETMTRGRTNKEQNGREGGQMCQSRRKCRRVVNVFAIIASSVSHIKYKLPAFSSLSLCIQWCARILRNQKPFIFSSLFLSFQVLQFVIRSFSMHKKTSSLTRINFRIRNSVGNQLNWKTKIKKDKISKL